MQNNKTTLILVGVLIISLFGVGVFVTRVLNKKPTVVLSVAQTASAEGTQTDAADSTAPAAAPTYNPPKTFNYDRSTDLNVVTNEVDPQILDSDFDQLKTIIKSI